ncbi:MAG: DUF1080 domain-containing protein [Tepidisphaeraceae bacterium]
MPTLVEGQTPNVSVKLDTINLKNDDFGLKDQFISELSGFITPPRPGAYAFRLFSDDGSVLTIDGRTVVDNDGLHSAEEPKEGRLELAAGEHPFLLRHFDQSVDAELKLLWKPPGEKDFVPVPASAFTCPAGEVRVTAPGVKRVTFSNEPPTRPGDRRPLVAVHPGFDLSPARPDGFEPKVGGIDFLPDGRLILCTWDPIGAVYIIKGHETGDPKRMTVTRFAAGLAEPLGIKVVGDRIFVLQKQELTELIDHDKDGVCDEYRCVSAEWDVTPNFHEFAFGLAFKDNAFYAGLAVALNPGGKTKEPQVKGRGTVLKIGMDGKTETVANGLRTPNGLTITPAGDLFITDNQGDWLPSSKLINIKPGRFYGNHIKPDHPNAGLPPSPPVVWLPQNELANSPSEPAFVTTGPYAGQMLLGEVTHGGLNRVFMEQVDGEWQGAAFQFTQGLEGGVNRVRIAPDGSIYTGQIGSSGNWGQAGKKSYGLQRITANGKTAFEPLAVRAMSDGFEIELTEPLAAGLGDEPDDYDVQTWRYEPTGNYGGPKVDVEAVFPNGVHISDDRKKIFVPVPNLKAGNVYYLRLPPYWKSTSGQTLWITEAYYTLIHIPTNKPGPKVNDRPANNTLTDAEKTAGWQLLFDGQDIAKAFRGYRKEQPPDGWRVVAGTLTRVGGGGDLVSREQFDDFELTLDWRVPEGGNSGVYYRANESGAYGWQTGPEMQILDDERHPDGKNPLTSAGAAYAVFAPTAKAARPAGAWNTARLVVQGGHVEHWLNGQKVVDYTLGSPTWRSAVSAGKFKDVKGYGTLPTGHIMLQDHGDAVAFRNIKIRKLPPGRIPSDGVERPKRVL